MKEQETKSLPIPEGWEFAGMMSGVTLGFIELYDTKPVAEFTREDWEHTRVGEYVYDRLRSLCNRVFFDGESFRR